MRFKERLTQSASEFGIICFQLVQLRAEDFPPQRIPFSMQPVRRKPQDSIASHDCPACDAFASFHHSHDEPRQVVISGNIHPRHLSRLAAYERAPGIRASPGQSADYAFHLFGDKLAHSDVIKKKERLSPAGENIVYTVIDQINAHGIVLIEHDGELELGAYP